MFAWLSHLNDALVRRICTASLMFGACLAPSMAQPTGPQISLPVEHVFAGKTFHAFVPAQPGWCAEEINMLVYREESDREWGRPDLAGEAKAIATAVRKRCPQMKVANIKGAYGSMDNPTQRPLYERRYEENPAMGFLVSEKSGGQFRNSDPRYTFVISKADQAKVSGIKSEEAAETKRRAEGKFGTPNIADMQAYVTQSLATIFDSNEVRGMTVSNMFLGEAVFSRTTVVDAVECKKTKEQYRCTASVRSTNGPSMLQGNESPWETSGFTDTCSWASPGKLKCSDIEARVSEALAKRANRGNSNARATGTSNFDFFQHQKQVYCSSAPLGSFAHSFGNC